MNVYKVFQSSGVPLHTRVEIESYNVSVDGFINTPGEHIIIHGPSKTGKTTLWNSKIGEGNVIKIPCNENTTLESVYRDIVDDLDVFFTSSTSVDKSVKESFGAELKAKFYGAFSASAKASSESNAGESSISNRLSAPTVGARNIAKYLISANKYVVLENIHYSSYEFRRQLSKELHNFSDYGSKWIIVGVQHQADQVFIENRDLVGRLREIKCGIFDVDKSKEVLHLGAMIMYVEFSDELKNAIYTESGGYAALIQDIAKNLCIHSGVIYPQESIKKIDIEMLDVACTSIAKSCEQVYSRYCSDIIQGGRSDGSTEKYKWFLKLVLNGKIPNNGLLNTEVYSEIVKLGHTDITQTSVTQGLQYLNKLQQKRSINPPVVEFDEAKNRFYLLDPYFKFCLRWIPELIDGK